MKALALFVFSMLMGCGASVDDKPESPCVTAYPAPFTPTVDTGTLVLLPFGDAGLVSTCVPTDAGTYICTPPPGYCIPEPRS